MYPNPNWPSSESVVTLGSNKELNKRQINSIIFIYFFLFIAFIYNKASIIQHKNKEKRVIKFVLRWDT